MKLMSESRTILCLPNELLVAISAAGQQSGHLLPDFQPAFKSERTLSQVSQRFRDVIIGAPTLWTRVEADLDLASSVEMAKLYLKRSRECRIWVSLRQVAHPDHNIVNLVVDGLDHIFSHFHRISRFKLTLRLSLVLTVFREWVGLDPQQHPEITRVKQKHYASVPGTPQLAFLKPDGRPFLHRSMYSASDPDVGNLLASLTTHCLSLTYLYVDMKSIREPYRLHIPSLKHLHVSVSSTEDTDHLTAVIALFDFPAVTTLTIENTHGDQIFDLFNATSTSTTPPSFPAVTTLTFVAPSESCTCTEDNLDPFTQTIESSPLQLFPALSSLVLIEPCFTSLIVTAILQQPQPLLQTIALCPPDRDLEDVDRALRRAKEQGLIRPKLRLSADLLSRVSAWEAADAIAEMEDDTQRNAKAQYVSVPSHVGFGFAALATFQDPHARSDVSDVHVALGDAMPSEGR
ncbi:hypothetical protein C8R46DRAFT_1220062 [Mycena filopes]|nr:hypothetical protein C8R46DRAFT_1220062 [Mycena filopes]